MGEPAGREKVMWPRDDVAAGFGDAVGDAPWPDAGAAGATDLAGEGEDDVPFAKRGRLRG